MSSNLCAMALALSGLVAACSSPVAQTGVASAGHDGGDAAPVAAAPVEDAGLESNGGVSLTVSWDPAPAAALSPGPRNACGVERRARLRVHTLGGVRGAVATLSTPESSPAEARGVELTIRDCRPWPSISIASRIAIINGDERRHLVRVDRLEPAAKVSSFSLGIVGQGYELGLEQAGVHRVRAEADRGDPSYVFVPGDGHAALTDERGRARLENVPPGTHELLVWHPPVTRGGPPLVASAEVTVEAGRVVEQTLTLGR